MVDHSTHNVDYYQFIAMVMLLEDNLMLLVFLNIATRGNEKTK